MLGERMSRWPSLTPVPSSVLVSRAHRFCDLAGLKFLLIPPQKQNRQFANVKGMVCLDFASLPGDMCL